MDRAQKKEARSNNADTDDIEPLLIETRRAKVEFGREEDPELEANEEEKIAKHIKSIFVDQRNFRKIYEEHERNILWQARKEATKEEMLEECFKTQRKKIEGEMLEGVRKTPQGKKIIGEMDEAISQFRLQQNLKDAISDSKHADEQAADSELPGQNRMSGNLPPPTAPTYIKVHKRQLDIETLRYFGLPWEYEVSLTAPSTLRLCSELPPMLLTLMTG